MPYQLLGGFINGLFNLAGTAASNAQARQNALMTNQTNLKLAREQNEWTERMWHMSNQYNSPLEQARRLKQAGLSDAAAASSVAGVPAQPMQSANLANQQQLPVPQVPDMSGFSGLSIIGLMREMQALRKETSEANMLEDEEGYKLSFLSSEEDIKMAAAKQAWQDLYQTAMLFPHSFNALIYENQKKQAERDYIDENRRYVEMEREKLKQDFDFAAKMQPEQFKVIQQELANLKRTEENLIAQKANIESSTSVNYAQQRNIEQSTENLESQNEGIQKDNILKELDIILKKAGSPESVTQRIAAFYADGAISLEDISKMFSCMRTYVETGKLMLDNVSPDVQRLLEEIVDEGMSKTLHHTPGSHGYFRGASRRIKEIFGYNK